MGPVLKADLISRGRRLTRCSDGASVFSHHSVVAAMRGSLLRCFIL
jgi:hypothetical protein